MILIIFSVLLAFTIIIIIGGKFIEAPGLQLAGYCFLFLLGLVILFNNLEYQGGETTTITSYYDNTTNTTNTNETMNYTYIHFENEIYAGVNLNHIIGLFTCIISGLGFAIVLMNLDKFKIKENE